jgi:hypothetical protein
MTLAPLAAVMMVLAASPPRASRAPQSRSWAAAAANRGKGGNKVDNAVKEFNRGDFPAALKLLQAALEEASDPELISRIQLLRGQAYGAEQDFSRAEEAFNAALLADPEVSLDPARVDPQLVKLLDGLRERLKGELFVKSDGQKAQVSLDGVSLGETPVRIDVAVGRHALEVVAKDAVTLRQQISVRPGKAIELELQIAKRGPAGVSDEDSVRRPFADLRGQVTPFDLPLNASGFEIGGGLDLPSSRVSLSAQVFPVFGLTPRGAVVVPISDLLVGYVEAELPFVFRNTFHLGLGGSGGVEYFPLRWAGVFMQVGARHFFIGADLSNLAGFQGGVRLRMP